MPRRSIGDIRREQLSQAAFDALVEHGIRGATLEKVAKRAGVSKGVVLHHFKDKDALFEAVMRKSNAVLKDGVLELFRHAETPFERLYAVIVGNFAEHIFQKEICNGWISLCADVPYNLQSQRIQNVIHARIHSNLASALRHIVPPDDKDKIAFQLTTVIDGVWIRASLQAQAMSCKEGIDYVDVVLHHLVDPKKVHSNQLHQARAKMEVLANVILTSNAFQAKAIRA
ncbi:MAG: transcriptional regulator BetI [Paracoccaceae bacterium]